MAKSETIIVRVDRATKDRIAAAAGRLGKSLTTFILEAAVGAANRVEAARTRKEQSKGKWACPDWFATACREAGHGGTGGYALAGLKLARALPLLVPRGVGEEEWYRQLDALADLLHVGHEPGTRPEPDGRAVWEWFNDHLPRCAALVPARRRRQFLAGVYASVKDGTIGLEP